MCSEACVAKFGIEWASGAAQSVLGGPSGFCGRGNQRARRGPRGADGHCAAAEWGGPPQCGSRKGRRGLVAAFRSLFQGSGAWQVHDVPR